MRYCFFITCAICSLLFRYSEYAYAACSQEQNNARHITARIAEEWPLRPVHDRRSRYLQNIADRLASTIKRWQEANDFFNWPIHSWQIIIVRDLSVNAYSIGNGVIYITDGTLNFVDTESELISIVAHEMAHQLLDHFCQVGSTNRRYQIGSFVQVLDNDKEIEADRLAVQILKNASLPAKSLLDVIKKLPITVEKTQRQQRIHALKKQLYDIPSVPFTSSPEFYVIRHHSNDDSVE